MTFFEVIGLATACIVAHHTPVACVVPESTPHTPPAIVQPVFTGEATDVDLTAQSALIWDEETGAVLYEKNATVHRPIASISKLVSALTVLTLAQPENIVEIPASVRISQQEGADIRLPIGEHARIVELLEAGLVPSANDAMVTLAIATAGSEEAFVDTANQYAKHSGLTDTRISNATGLTGGEQYSTAYDVKRMMTLSWKNPIIGPLLSKQAGVLTTQEGTKRTYKSTNKLLGTYVPILAAKTGYTVEAGENLVMITHDKTGHRLGAVILGSTDRFQDMKVLVEWIWRNYTWK